jgi:hypothetical protein
VSGEMFSVYGTAASARKWAPGVPLAHRDTKEEADEAARQIRWRGSSRPTRIVKRTALRPDGTFTVLEEWKL